MVQDAEAYQSLLDRLERAEAIAAIRQGLAEFERGEGRSAREALEELRVKAWYNVELSADHLRQVLRKRG